MSPYSCIGPDDVPRLRDEHAFFERQLAEVIQLAAAGQRKGCELSWEVFSRDLERHMQYEENLLFRPFAKLGPVEHLWTELLHTEHQEFRRLCQTLSSEFVQLSLNVELLRELAGKLTVHKEREGQALYPWLGSLAPPRLSWERVRHGITPAFG